MSKRQERSLSSSSNSAPTPKRNREEMVDEQETESSTSLRMIMNKLNSIENRMDDNFSNLHTQLSTLRCELKVEIDGVKQTMKDVEKSLEGAWAAIEDVQQETKTYKDSKSSHQKMLDDQAQKTQLLETQLAIAQTEASLLAKNLRAAEENLIALESYTRRENLRFVNIAEKPGEDCTEVVLDIIQNELKINTDGLRFHAVHRVGKRHTHSSTAPLRPRPIIARFVVREDKDAVLAVKNRLTNSQKYKDAYITQDYAKAIQEERKVLIKAMFAARDQGQDAKVINRTLYINNKDYNAQNIPKDLLSAPEV